MSYEHVARIPFLINSVHLTPKETTERAANPTLWASRRYGQPEHIFKAAAERFERSYLGDAQTAAVQTAVGGVPSKMASDTFPQNPLQPAPSTPGPSSPQPKLLTTSQQASSIPSESSGPTSLSSRSHSSASESYFSTVLFPSTSSPSSDADQTEVGLPLSSWRENSSIPRSPYASSSSNPDHESVRDGPISAKKKGKT